MAEWNFPNNGDGQVKGVADAGIENFNGTEIASLARENCQNSLDAAIDDENPNVIVEFERYSIPTAEVPGIDEYEKVLSKCKEFWDNSKSERAKTFLENANRTAKRQTTSVLRISDFNTTGLADPYGENDPYGFNFDGWNSLVKIDGGANKGEDKQGNFGIGKSAPFSNSAYRLVFYRTLNEQNEIAAQGISRLLSFPTDISDKKSMTTGVGYYGDSDGNMPVEHIDELDSIYSRDRVGTDVFIYGFNGSAIDDQWKKDIKYAILDSFLMSIYRGNLSVKIQNTKIDADTLGNLITNAYAEKPGAMKSTYGNYQALTRKDGVHRYSKDFHGLGTLELTVLIAPNEKLDKKILIVRKAGMKLFRLGNISKLVSFSGVLELKGKELNSYFRKMESVAHDSWEPGRHPEPKQAKAYFEEIKEWIRGIVAELAEYTSDDEIEIEGLGGVLQDDVKKVDSGNEESKREGLNDYLGKIDVIQRTATTTSKGLFYGKGSDGTGNTEKKSGTIGKDGTAGIRILKGERKRKTTTKHKAVPDPKGQDVVESPVSGGETSCPLSNVRVLNRGKGSYIVSFEVPRAIARGRVELVTVGENGKSNKLRMNSANSIDGCQNVTIQGDSISFSNMESGKKVKLNVSLATTYDYAMEVNVYEHN